MPDDQHFDLPFDDFESHLCPTLLSQNIVIVSAIGKVNWAEEVTSVRTVDRVFRFRRPTRSRKPDRESMCHIEGKYAVEERVLYLNLVGPWNVNHLNAVWKQIIEEMNEMGFLHCWNLHTNIYARAILFIFTLSHIVIVDHPSHTPDFSILQLLKLLSFLRPKYQIWQTKLLTKIMDGKDEWFLHGRLCSPRLLFVFSCPPDILAEEEDEKIQRTKRLERAIEDTIYMTLRKSRIVKYVCNRAFYSIAPNDEFVFVETTPPEEPIDQLERFLSDAPSNDDSDSEEENMYMHPFSTVKKGHRFREFLEKHIAKAQSDGFYDNMGKYTHVKPFFERPTLGTWLKAANAIIHDPDIGLENKLSVFPAMHNVTLPEVQQAIDSARSATASHLGMAMYQTHRTPSFNHGSKDRKGSVVKDPRQDKKKEEDKQKLLIHKKKLSKFTPEDTPIDPWVRQSKT